MNKGLAYIYSDLHFDLKSNLSDVEGITLEVGSGASGYRNVHPDVICSDIIFSEELDLVCDAQKLPFRRQSLSNIVMFDVFHHLQEPIAFLKQSEYLLKPGGRIVMVEPYVSFVSFIIYRIFHFEDTSFSFNLENPFGSEKKDPHAGNQTIPTVVFGSAWLQIAREVPKLELISKRRCSLLAYPLTGGLRSKGIVPLWFLKKLLWIDKRLERIFGRILAFRIIIVLERIADGIS